MSSMNVFYALRRKPAKRSKSGYKPRSRPVGTSMPPGTRSVASQASRGRKSQNYQPSGYAQRVGNAVATQVSNAVSRTVTENRTSKSKAIVNIPKKVRQVNTVSEMVKAFMLKQSTICQALVEGDDQTGFNTLLNGVTDTLARPLHVWALNTRVSASPNVVGTTYPRYDLTQTTNFNLRSGATDPIMALGNTQDSKGETYGDAAKVLFDSVKVKMMFYGRVNRDTKYTVKIIRLKKKAVHLSPYFGAEEDTDAVGRLTANELSERRAFWIDFMLRPQTVNPCVISKLGLSKFKTYYETLYSRVIEVGETLTDEDQSNRTTISINLPIKKMMNYNYAINSRYDSQTLATRVDSALNTATTDMLDTKWARKPAPHSGLFLIVTANNTTTGAEDTTQQEGANFDATKVPSYDIAYECIYKTFAWDT